MSASTSGTSAYYRINVQFALFFVISSSSFNILLAFDQTCPIYDCWQRTLNETVRAANCSHRGLSMLPTNLSREIRILDLSDNKLQNTKNFMSLSQFSLVEIRLSHNYIYDVSRLCVMLPYIVHLDISRNEIVYLDEWSFRSNDHLRYLNISDNHIDQIHADAFKEQYRLKILDLSTNYLQKIDITWFKDLKSLETLQLSRNKLIHLDSHAFASLVNLHELGLSSNGLFDLDQLAFRGLDTLNTLILSDNDLKTSPNHAWESLSSLEYIDLSSNWFHSFGDCDFHDANVTTIILQKMPHLHMIGEKSFCNLPKLRRLEISHCPMLNYIHPGAFEWVPKLTEVDLQYNSLALLPEALIDNIELLSHFDIRGNALICECNTKWFGDLVNASFEMYIDENPTCIVNKNESYAMTLSACPPQMTASISDEYEYVVGESTTFACYAIGAPWPIVYWQKMEEGDTENKWSNLSFGNVLTFESLVLSDNGRYNCIAGNAAGQAKLSFNMFVHQISAQLITLHNTATSITIAWKRSNNEQIYEILYREENSTESYIRLSIHPIVKSITLQKLRPETSYEICLALEGTSAIKCICALTASNVTVSGGIINSRDLILGISIGSVSVFLCMVSCAMVLINRYNSKHENGQYYMSQSTSQQAFIGGSCRGSLSSPVSYENQAADLTDEEFSFAPTTSLFYNEVIEI